MIFDDNVWVMDFGDGILVLQFFFGFFVGFGFTVMALRLLVFDTFLCVAFSFWLFDVFWFCWFSSVLVFVMF